MSSLRLNPQWKPLAEMWSAKRAEYALVPGYELVAFEHGSQLGGKIGWEVFTGPQLEDLVASGPAPSFEEAKHQAEAAWRGLAG